MEVIIILTNNNILAVENLIYNGVLVIPLNLLLNIVIKQCPSKIK